MTKVPDYGQGKALQRYAELAKWYELHLEHISREYAGERDYPGQIARKALAERAAILSATNETRGSV
jgi:hypothetical protein